jgi:hypothetical protein
MKEGDWANENRPSDYTSLLSLEELNDSLWIWVEFEGLVVLERRLDVVVVRVEPFYHLQARNIDTLLLEATTHGEVFIDRVELVLCVPLGDSLGDMD